MKLCVILFLFVFVCSQDTENSNGSCNNLCLTVIGSLFAIFILSIPTAFILYFISKCIWNSIKKYLKKQQLNDIKPDLNGIEMTRGPFRGKNGNISDTNTVKSSVTMLEIIDELPET